MSTPDLAEAVAAWEAKYTADQLKAMLARGQAIRNDAGDPSYPIADKEDLQRAIRAVGRGGAGHDKIRRYIIGRAKALGAMDMIPDGWSAAGASKGASEAAGPVQVGETITLTEARGAAAVTGSRMRIKLIDAGWGSSGYYSPKVLAEAAAGGVFPAGTQMFLDHPGATESVDRPERSVRDLAAVLTSPAVFKDGALYAEARVFSPFQQLLADMGDAIGVSIRASGTAEPGEAEGRRGMLITGLTEGISVDFVTRAGRGGQIVEVLESARKGFDSSQLTAWAMGKARDLAEARTIGAWLESKIHAAFTGLTDCMYGDGQLTRDERIALSSAIGDALDAFVKRVEADQPQLYQRDLYDGPDEEPEDPEDTATPMAESIVPAPPAKPTTRGVSMSGGTDQGAPSQGGATEISEADRLRTENTKLKDELAEARLKIAQHGENDRELADTRASLEEARRENLRLKANGQARDKAMETLAESTLPKIAHPVVVAAVTGDNVPLNEDGALDEAALVENIRAAIESQRRYLAGFAQESGLGTVRGLGPSGSGDDLTEADVEAGLKDVFTNIGLPAAVADIAAKGR